MKRDYFHLDFVAGWREDSRTGLILTPVDGNMRLPALAGRGRRIILGGYPAVACVKSMVVDGCGDLYLLDAGKNLIRRLGATDRGIEAPGCKSSPLEKISGI